MKVYLAADHRGFELKAFLMDKLAASGLEVEDCGAYELDADDDYPDYGEKAAAAVAGGGIESRGVVICGSGVGIAVAANKIPGIRASLIHDEEILRKARGDDDVNVLALGADYLGKEEALKLVMIFLEEPFSEADRHKRRIGKIQLLEDKYCK